MIAPNEPRKFRRSRACNDYTQAASINPQATPQQGKGKEKKQGSLVSRMGCLLVPFPYSRPNRLRLRSGESSKARSFPTLRDLDQDHGMRKTPVQLRFITFLRMSTQCCINRKQRTEDTVSCSRYSLKEKLAWKRSKKIICACNKVRGLPYVMLTSATYNPLLGLPFSKVRSSRQVCPKLLSINFSSVSSIVFFLSSSFEGGSYTSLAP
jgi:hypothetical protein